ncbi:VWA domain-containing protein [Proteobacteria bacterium 005FR1]|nr:VWA domain-containing protein [Proteobacteria bacterium 005FR1]
MAFLTPLFLFGLLAAVIPVAIHFIRRDKPPKIVFSTLRFFQQTSRKQFLFQKMQQWLLLLLRTAAVVLLAIAFARPFFGQALSGWTDMAPRSVVLLIDNSMSMSYGDYLQRAKSAARDVLAELGPDDEAAVVLFSDKADAVYGPSSDLATLQAAIDRIDKPGYQVTRYFPALRLADEMLANSRFHDKSVHLISDFQNSGMTGFESGWTLKPGVNFVTENVADRETRNLTITGVKSPANLREAGQEEALFVRVRSMGNLQQDGAELAVSIDGEEQFRKQVSLQNRSEVVVKVPVTFAGEGSHVGRVSVADPGFDRDNDFYFTLDVLPKIPVLVVNGEASGNWYDDEAHWFRLALSSNEQSPFAVETATPENLHVADLARYRVIAMLNVGQVEHQLASALQNYVREGGSLLLAPGDRVEAGAFNRQFAAVSAGSLLSRASLSEDDYLLIADASERHPILRPLELDWGARFGESWITKPADSAEVLMTYDNGAPAMIERQIGRGRSLLFASSLDLEWNNLPLQSMYLPLIHQSLKYLANTPEKKASYLVGETVALEGVARDAKLLSPDGRALTLQEGEENFTLREPGVYRQNGEGGTTLYAVNHAAEESNLAGLAPEVIFDQVLNPETTPNQSAAVRSQMLKAELEKPQRLWWWVLLAVAILLVAESLIANRTYR